MPSPYSDAEQDLGQRVMLREGVLSRAMEGLTGGVVLAAFALMLGAGDLAIGLVAAVPFLVQLAHVPAVAVLARFPDRRQVAVTAAVAARGILALLAVLPFLPASYPRLGLLVALLVAYATVATFAGAAWQAWVRDLVPRDRIGAYFGRRMSLLSVVGLLTLLAAGQFLAAWSARFPGREGEGFAVLFAAGAALGFGAALVLRRAPSVPARGSLDAGGLRASLRRPFGDRNYRRLLVFLGAWGFAANFALPFVTVVLLRVMGYGLPVVTALAAASTVANVVGFRLFAPLTDRFGNKPVMAVSAVGFLVTLVAWALLPNEPGTLTLAGAATVHVLLGFSLAGLDLAANGVVLKLAPEGDSAAYLSSASVVRALSAGVAPLVAGVLATFLAPHSFTVRLEWADANSAASVAALHFQHHDFLFLMSAVLGLYALHRLLGFEEAGEASTDEVVRAMRREVTQVSSVAGMRTFAHLSSYVTEMSRREWRGVRVRAERPRAVTDAPPK